MSSPARPSYPSSVSSDGSHSPTSFAVGAWGAQKVYGAQLTRASTTDLRAARQLHPMRASSGPAAISPALPESPEMLTPLARVGPNVPRTGTLPPAPVVGLLRPPLPVASLPPRQSLASQIPASQSLPPPIPSRSLGRKLPPTLTESLELLVQVRDHCRELERMHTVPEDEHEVSHKLPSTPRPKRKTTLTLPETLPPTPVPRMTRAGSSSSSSSGDWPETPHTSTQALAAFTTFHASASLPCLQQSPSPRRGVEHIASAADLKRPRFARQPAMSSTNLDNRPSVAQLLYASELQLTAEDGSTIRLGELLGGAGRTIVVFVRHWLSPSCGTYLKSLIAALTPQVLARARSRVVIVGLGSHTMIKGYRQHFQCPFPVYTDASRRMHDVLGLAPRGPKLEHAGRFKGAKDMLVCAARMHGLRAGNRSQLGGEFVFEGALNVLFAHRMTGGTDHAPLDALVRAINLPSIQPMQRAPPRPARPAQRTSSYIVPAPRMQAVSRHPAAYSCTNLVSREPMEFPLPPSEWEWDRKRRAVAVVHPEDIDRVAQHLRSQCVV